MYLVLLETSGNQRYIFSTNKLRENVGASELTYQIGTSIVTEVVRKINSRSEEEAITPLITTSGKALLFVRGDNNSVAKEVVRNVTTHALKEMPGLTVHGKISEISDATSATSIHDAVCNVHQKLEEIRLQIPNNLLRFQRIPFVAECASSNLPASQVVEFRNRSGSDVFAFSEPTIAKRRALAVNKEKLADDADFRKGRIIDELEKSFKVEIPTNLEKLELAFPETKWLAVVHADGNGLGQIFLNFDKHADISNAGSYEKDYREFSDDIDRCTRNAFGNALKSLQEKFPGNQIPVIPLILGGDDLTFLCDGEYAVSLTRDFLRNFESECFRSPIIRRLTTTGDVCTPLGICAGIAIIKPHFPFHQAYTLAEELLGSAKRSKNVSSSLSAFDYHVLYDSSGTTLEEIRSKMPFVARPYVVTDLAAAKEYTPNTQHQKWIEDHHFDQLERRVDVLKQPDDEDSEKRSLPSSQTHILREALFLGGSNNDVQAAVDSRAALISHRYPTFAELYADASAETLFFEDVTFNSVRSIEKRTYLLDAMDLVEFWK